MARTLTALLVLVTLALFGPALSGCPSDWPVDDDTGGPAGGDDDSADDDTGDDTGDDDSAS